jgi:hypothetical protein
MCMVFSFDFGGSLVLRIQILGESAKRVESRFTMSAALGRIAFHAPFVLASYLELLCDEDEHDALVSIRVFSVAASTSTRRFPC